MNFGKAIEALKQGRHLARDGWNGKGMCIYLAEGLVAPRHTLDVLEPVIVMFTAQQKHQPGWLASQADMLAEDWTIIEPPPTSR